MNNNSYTENNLYGICGVYLNQKVIKKSIYFKSRVSALKVCKALNSNSKKIIYYPFITSEQELTKKSLAINIDTHISKIEKQQKLMSCGIFNYKIYSTAEEYFQQINNEKTINK